MLFEISVGRFAWSLDQCTRLVIVDYVEDMQLGARRVREERTALDGAIRPGREIGGDYG